MSDEYRTVLVFGLQEHLLAQVIEELSHSFASVAGTTLLSEVVYRLKANPPDLLVVGGGVPSDMRHAVFEVIASMGAHTRVAEPRGPDDVFASIDRMVRD